MSDRISRKAAIDWLDEAARYFLKLPDNGEDSAFWAHRMNAENALKIAATLRGDQAWAVMPDPEAEAIEVKAREIYESWSGEEGYTPWVPGGNSLKQDDARRAARAALKHD